MASQENTEPRSSPFPCWVPQAVTWKKTIMPQEKVSFIQRKREILSQNILCRNDAQNLWKFCSLLQRKLEHGAPTCTDWPFGSMSASLRSDGVSLWIVINYIKKLQCSIVCMSRCSLLILTMIFPLCIVNRLGVTLIEGSLAGYECSTPDQKLLIVITLLGRWCLLLRYLH